MPLREEALKPVLPARHLAARPKGPVAVAALRDDAGVVGAAGTGHHALVIDTCRSLGGYEPDVRHRSKRRRRLGRLVRTTGAVALMPLLTLPPNDPALAVRDIREAGIRRRLMTVTRDGLPAPALSAFLAALEECAAEVAP